MVDKSTDSGVAVFPQAGIDQTLDEMVEMSTVWCRYIGEPGDSVRSTVGGQRVCGRRAAFSSRSVEKSTIIKRLTTMEYRRARNRR